MPNKKTIVAFFVVFVAVIVSIFIIARGPDVTSSEVSISTGYENDNPAFQFESGRPELEIPPQQPPPLAQGPQDTSNLTELLIKSYARKLFENEQGFPSTGSAASIVQENLGQALTFPRFDSKDISVSSDNSTENRIAYIETVDALLYKHFKEFEGESLLTALELFSQRNDSQLFDYLIGNIPPHIDDLLMLEVPSTWKNIHLEMLNLWQKKLFTYRAIVNTHADPLKAYIAMQQLPEIIQKDIDIQIVLIQEYETLILNNA